MFEFGKLYADVVMPDGALGIIYQTTLRAAGFHGHLSGFEWYSPGGTRTVMRIRGHAPIRPPGDGSAFTIDIPFAAAHLRARYTPMLASYEPDVSPSEHISWTVPMPRARVQLTLDAGDESRTGLGEGYIDCVELRRPPRRLGLSELDWGRLHLPGGSLVYTRVRFRNRPAWKLAARWDADGFQVHDDLELGPTPDGTRLALPGSSIAYLLRARRELHTGDGIDDAHRFPNKLERLLTRCISGPIHETRTFSGVYPDPTGQMYPDPTGHAVPGPTGHAVPGQALHECVRFGGGKLRTGAHA